MDYLSVQPHGGFAKDVDDVAPIVRDLPVREAQADESGGRQDLIAAPVACLLGRRAVVAEAVGLDDQAELRPVEVDPPTS